MPNLDDGHYRILSILRGGRTSVEAAVMEYGRQVGFVGAEVSVAFGMLLQDLIIHGLVDRQTGPPEARDHQIIREIWLTGEGRAALAGKS